ncbi:MAG: acyl-CoA dehydrogenase, partial [Burkholderiales bacterium]
AYNAPVKDMQFVLHELIGLDRVAKLPGCEEVTADVVDAILDEASKFSRDVLAPLNWSGDVEGAVWNDGNVSTPKGFKDAYQKFTENGWGALRTDPDYGGQGLPNLVSTPVDEMIAASNMAFSLCPMLTQGAYEAIHLVGTDQQKQTYLHNMVSGKWTGTMNLTEPQAGSDLAAIRTKAVPQGDHFLITGQKIYITYGEHDYTENIIHLVLARTPTAPEGVKGISLFIVPKFLVNGDGSLGKRNDVRCVSIEHKLGIHGSPTAVLAYGDKGGAVGYLIGEENRGLEYMFIMMNLARFNVGLEGVAIGERAYQGALAYAKERVQGTETGKKGGARVAIIKHPDVKRMLLTMKSQVEAMRAVAYYAAACLDNGQRHATPENKKREQLRAELLIPIVKGWSTETGQEIASTGVQIHGGMGFIEETGAAQHYRDARITTIYEGTTAIQANDLIGRKLGRDAGATMRALIEDMQKTAAALAASDHADCKAIAASLGKSVEGLGVSTISLMQSFSRDAQEPAAVAVPFLMQFGTVAGGWQMGAAALIAANHLKAGTGDADFYKGKIATARFYADHILPRAQALKMEVINGAASVLALDEALF